MKYKAEWEMVNREVTEVCLRETRRMKVPEGWIVHTSFCAMGNGRVVATEASVFVPDLGHTWELEGGEG
jgi:hypothetical protein